MPGPTRERFNEVQARAAEIVTLVGGVTAVDQLSDEARKRQLVAMAHELMARTEVRYPTARSHIAKAMRRARYQIVKEREEWGGKRPGAGAPEGNKNARKDEAAHSGPMPKGKES
jgi:hypothetical protein